MTLQEHQEQHIKARHASGLSAGSMWHVAVNIG